MISFKPKTGMIFDIKYGNSIQMKAVFVLLMFLVPLLSFSQELIIIDEQKNPIANVSAFNLSKTKSALSNNEGIINLSRFSNNDTVCFQHPNYKFKKILKHHIAEFITLYTNYSILEDVLIEDKKNINNINNVAEKKIYITKEKITKLNGATPADILEKSGGVSVQRSQMGGGSPNIRGFEANKVLLMVDGVRLNNAIYRSGHLQNILTIDEYILSDIEVIFGPSSVLYGSDALGGTINMQTREVFFRPERVWSGQLSSAYNSGYTGFKNNLSLSFESPNYATITSISFKDFGDLRMGRWRPHGHQDWGLVYHYVDGDSVLCNPDPNIQRGVGYSQYDIFNKMIFKTSENSRITSNIQYSSSSNIPRFDKLNDNDGMCLIDSAGGCLSGHNLKFHSYYYGPQERFLGSLKFSIFDDNNNSNYFDKADFIIAYQKIKESRHRWYMDDFLDYLNHPEAYDQPTHQYETVGVYSLNTNIRKGNWFFGSETIYNDVISKAGPNQENIWGVGDTRYPPNGSNMFSTAYYLNVLYPISEKLQVEGGLRYTFSNLKGYFPDSLRRPLLDVEGLKISSSASVFSGNLKFLYYPNNSLKISSVTSKGFHSPNVDDMLKVFKKGDNITIPNIDLTTEHAWSQEFSMTKNLSPNFSIYGVGFFTILNNAIVKDSVQININPDLNGDPFWANQIWYDDELVYTFANQNSKDQISIYGFSLGFNARAGGLELSGDFNLTNGVDRGTNSGPVAHIPPNFGKMEIKKALNSWELMVFCIYSGFKAANSFDEAGVDNLDEAPAPTENSSILHGLPGWWVLNFTTEYTASNNLQLNIGVDNILDVHYKTFGSGISAAGRSLIVSAQYRF